MKEKLKFQAKSVSIAQETDRIIEVAEKLGMVLPSTHTALFQSVYAPIDEANLNGVRLDKIAVKNALPGLIGAQANLEHFGRGFMLGIVLDAWLNDSNEIEIIFSFAKNLYEQEYENAIDLMNKGELSVSFELMAETDEQEQLGDGTVLLHDIDFQGVGVLLDNPPAYPGAKVYQFARQTKNRISKMNERDLMFASKIIDQCDKILKADKWTSDIYNNFPNSSFAVIEPAFLNGETGNVQARHLAFKDRNGRIDSTNYFMALDRVDKILPVTDSITTEELRKQAKEELDKHIDVFANKKEPNQGGNTKVTEKQKAKVEEIRAELGDYCKDISDDDLLNDEKVAELRAEKETKEAEAVKKADEKKKEIAYKVDSVEIKTFSLEDVDGVETIVETVERMTVTDFTAMKASVEKVAELEASLEAKNSEIEVVRENAETIGKTKVQLSDNEFAKDFSDEDYLNEEKVAKAIQDQEDAKVIADRKEELKDNEYAKDFTDEDLLNDTKVELAKVKKEKDELEANKDKTPEEIKAAKKEEEEEELPTGDSDKKDEYAEVMASIQKDNTQRDTQTIYEKIDNENAP